jgi:hypothetical protein
MNAKGNTFRVERVQDLRKSGAAGTHGDRRLKRQKTRAAQKRAALKEYS